MTGAEDHAGVNRHNQQGLWKQEI